MIDNLRKPKKADPGLRVPPHSEEAEICVLGSVLIDNRALNRALEWIGPEDFYRHAHEVIFAAMISLVDSGEPIDQITLMDRIKGQSQLEAAGGASSIAALVDSVPTSANVENYAKIIRERSVQRRLIEVGHDIVQAGFQTTENVDELVDEAQRRIFDVAERRIKSGLVPVRDLVRPTFKIIEELQEKKSQVTGVPSDFPDLDNLTSGFQKSDLIIIASRPSMGKTSLALNIAQRAAIDHGLIVALFSLEMSATQLMIRILSAEARVDSQQLRKGFLDNEAMIDLTSAAGRIDEAAIYIDDTASLTVTEMKAKSRRLHSERGLDLVIVDYLQLMQGRANAERRDLEVGEISRSLKGLAKELDVPVIALSQLRRAVEDRPSKRPQLSDLRESGAIEQDADVILFIYREEMYHRDENEGDRQSHEGIAEIIVGKQRNGPTGKIELTFIKKYSRFESRARGYDE